MKLDGIKKVPMWVWGLLLGGLLVAWMWASRMNSGAAPSSEEDAESQLVGWEAGTPGVGVIGTNDGTGYQGQEQTTSTPEMTNAQWIAQAVKVVTNGKNTSAVATQKAMQKYVYGEGTLTAVETAWVNYAIDRLGVPPEGTGAIPDFEEGPTKTEQDALDKAAQAEKDRAAAEAAAKAAADKAAAEKSALQKALDAANAALKKAQEAVKPTTPKPTTPTTPTKPKPTTPAKAKTYTIKTGDQLGKIALKYKKNSVTGARDLYAANKAIIEARAKKAGKKSSENGKWIYAGTVLTLPKGW